jgi:phage terminase large subunit
MIPYKYTPRDYQISIMSQVPKYYPRGVFVHHRRAGKDKSAWNKIILEASKKKAVYYYFFPTYQQGRKVIWDGIDPKTGMKYLDHIPPSLIKKKNDSEMKLILFNDSLVQIVGTDNFNSIMGTPPYGCVFSEYSLQDPRVWDYIRPILRENGGWAIFIYTPRGKNHGYHLYKMAQHSDDWFVDLKTVKQTFREDGSFVIDREDIEKDRAEGMADELIQQEYYCSFEGYTHGAYYSKQLMQAKEDRRITNVPHVTGHEVYTAWDLGIDDSTTLWFFQQINQQIRFIDYYENSGEGLVHYAKIMKDKPYVYGDHYFPHDVEVRELGTGRSRTEVLKALNISPIIIIQRARDINAVLNGIESGRNIMSQCWFDEDKCQRGLLALENYHAEYDEEKKKLENRPAHDWSSHGADAFRTFAVGYQPKVKHVSVTAMLAR